MTNTDIISNFMRRLELWIYDNIGSGDGTNHILTIWKDNPYMASHLVDKWLGYVRKARSAAGADAEEQTVQTMALLEFLGSLDESNHKTFIKYIAENGRPMY